MSFLIDECITQPVARALLAVKCDVVYAPDVIGIGAKDPAVYDYATTNAMIVLTQDKEMGKDYTKRVVVLGSGCGVIILRRPKEDNMRLKLVRILTLWDELERIKVTLKPPYIFEARAYGVRLTRLR